MTSIKPTIHRIDKQVPLKKIGDIKISRKEEMLGLLGYDFAFSIFFSFLFRSFIKYNCHTISYSFLKYKTGHILTYILL